MKDNLIKKYWPIFSAFVVLSSFLVYFLSRSYVSNRVSLIEQLNLIYENIYKNEESLVFEEAIKELRLFNKVNQQTQPSNSGNSKKKVRPLSLTIKNDENINGKKVVMNFTSFAEDFDTTIGASEMTPRTFKSIKISTTPMNFDSLVKERIDSALVIANTTVDNIKTDVAPKTGKVIKKVTQSFTSAVSIDSTAFTINPSVSYAKVNAMFAKELKQKEIDVKYSVDTLYNKVFKTQNENQKNVKLLDGSWYLWKLLFPELLLSLLVLSAVGIGFWFTLRAINKEAKYNNERTSFLNNMTHELKTPISTVKVALEAIKLFEAGKNENQRKEYTDLAITANDNLLNFIERVLHFSKRVEDGQPISSDYINSTDLIDECNQFFKPYLESKKIEFNHQIGLTSFKANKEIMMLIMQNLVDNAAKYNQSSNPTIEVSIAKLANRVQIKVTDNGTPISNELREKIFEKFYRIKQDNIHDDKGHGLGLYLVKEYARLLGGKVTCHSLENGNCFTLEIPYQA